MGADCPKASRASLLQIGKSQRSNIVLRQGFHAEAKAHTPELPRDGLFARQGTLPKQKQKAHKKQYAGAEKKQLPPTGAAGLVTGLTATLDEAGFREVQALRCPHPCMFDFIQRVIEQEGYSVCHMSGLAGFVIWFDAPEDGTSYLDLVNALHNAATTEDTVYNRAACSFLRAGSDKCTDLPPGCPGWPFATLPPCGKASSQNTSVEKAGGVVPTR